MLQVTKRQTGVLTGIIKANFGARNITYLHSGSRVRGLKRDPSEYLRLQNGLMYNEVKPENYQENVRKQLNLAKHNISLSDDIILQCLTHKSFAHGSKPYNEKLAALGMQFLKYHTSVHSLRSAKPLSPVAEGKNQKSINGLNFTNLGTQLSKLLIAKKTTAQVIRSRHLDSLIFWKKRDPLKNESFNGETTVYSGVLSALVGGILVTNGPQKTSQFIEKELLDPKKEASLVQIAKTMA
ncbi:mitochondrial 54S ribosomal protein mL57 [Lachancea thermotolerans CBS 6340]|uniref:KLTH0H08624p n=1 Tax=Lachancea thermotolerans (strain ATCC 56472 / CBS 6340 / NRRL Y-8284) TaxID=559295 RepID=C5E2X6_LACTC|nr:mitochondrial 54S ribosomal protein YmL15 [Lachancea thermotolerans CBS 6340]CAR30387.1 KLTH0H08624p [Lachancea thermotolerans CBS 6340]